MSEAGRDDDVSILLFINDSVCVVDSAAPPAAQIALQRFGFSDALIGVPLDVLQ